MIPSRGLRWSGIGISNGRQRLAAGQPNSRAFSGHALKRPSPQGRRPDQKCGALRISRLQQHRSISLFGWGSSAKSSPDDFAAIHTVPQATPPSQNVNKNWDINAPAIESDRSVKASHATSDAPDPSVSSLPHTPEPRILHDLENAVAVPRDVSVHSDAAADAADLSRIPEYIGYLKEVCGLDYGWGPTAILENCLEHLHITAGLSWAAAIPVLGIISHAIFLSPALKAADTTAKMREANPIIKPLRNEYMEAAKAKDQQKMLKLQTELKAVNKEYKISMWKAFLPILIQVPIQFGAFRLLRGMTTLPVPALEHENWLWTTDLTVGDPYFILPVVSSALVWLNFKLSVTMGGNTDGATASLQKMFTTIFPVINLGFMSIQPGAVQLWFITSSALVLMRTALMRNPNIRSLLGVHALPPPTPTNGAAVATTRLGGLNRGRTPVTTPSETVEATPSNRSIVDKVVDKVKAQKKGMTDGMNGLKTQVWGKAEDKRKSALLEKAEQYEARRQRQIETDREIKNEMERAAGRKRPGVITRSGGSQGVDDLFEDDATPDPMRSSTGSRGGKRRTRR